VAKTVSKTLLRTCSQLSPHWEMGEITEYRR